MKKKLHKSYGLKSQKNLFLLGMLTLSSLSFGQQGTGEFPVIDGSFNSTTFASGTTSSSTISSGTQFTEWNKNGTQTLSIETALSRTGPKSFKWVASGGSSRLFSPSFGDGELKNNTSYVVQFYGWKNYASGNARKILVALGVDGMASSITATDGTYMGLSNTIGSNSTISTAWEKVTVVVTTETSANSPRYGFLRLSPNGGGLTGSATDGGYYFDDLVIYEGTEADVTAPDPITNATVTVATPTSKNVVWDAPVSGVDGGGYLVVRYDTAPEADNNPNQNGIYSYLDTFISGAAPLTGTVVYNGTGTSFVDVVADSSVPHYYKFYTVDKAFNYSTAFDSTLSTNNITFNDNNVTVYKTNGNIEISSAKEIIDNVKVYDVRGRLLSELKKVNASSATISNLKSTKQLVVVKVTSQNGKVLTKKILN